MEPTMTRARIRRPALTFAAVTIATAGLIA
jgi:hypothetical protein